MSTSGKRFLADLSDLSAALPDGRESSLPAATEAATPAGQPAALSSGGGDLPDMSAHSWNVDVPDFVPVQRQPLQQQGPPLQPPQPLGVNSSRQWQPQQQQPQQSLDAISQLVSQTLAALVGLVSAGDRETADEQLNACLLRLYQAAQSSDDLNRLVLAALNSARRSREFSEPAANLLAFLAVNFVVSAQVCPYLLVQRSALANNPVYVSLLTVCSAENERIRREIATDRTLRPEQASYILLFAWLYLYLPSLKTPTERQGALAKETLIFLGQLVDLPSCPLAYRTVHAALASVGAPLEFDSADPDCPERGDLMKLLAGVYDRLRAASAEGRIGDPEVSLDIIRLLELRASCWIPRDAANFSAAAVAQASGGAAAAAGGGMPQYGDSGRGGFYSAEQLQHQGQAVMTDDMYADFETFLRDSGQL